MDIKEKCNCHFYYLGRRETSEAIFRFRDYFSHTLREMLCVTAWKTARNDARSSKIRSRRVATRRGVSQSFPLSFDIARCFFVFAGEWGISFACDIVTEIRPGMLTPEVERSAATGADKTPTLRGDAGVSLLIGDRWHYILVASYTERTALLKYYPSTNLRILHNYFIRPPK